MPKLITCSFCGGDGLEELFGEMPGAFGTCTNCAGTGKTESRTVAPITYESDYHRQEAEAYAAYIAEAKARAKAAGYRGDTYMIFPKDMPPIHKYAENGVDVIIDEATTAASYFWPGNNKARLDCASKFTHIANFRGVPEIPVQGDFSTAPADPVNVTRPDEDQDTPI